MMRYTVTLRDTRDSHEREIDMRSDWDHDEHIKYSFSSDGHFYCDCNLSRLLYPHNRDGHMGCSEGIIKVIQIRDETGRVVE
jgi:hypothetical protein